MEKRILWQFLFLFLLCASRLSAQNDLVLGEIMVQLASNTPIEKIIEPYKKTYYLAVKKQICTSPDIWLLVFDPQADAKALLNSLQETPSVLAAQYNHRLEIRSTPPNDPQYNGQWHLKNTGGGGATAGADIRAEDSWDLTTGGRTVNGDTIVVAIIDDGITVTHPDLQQNLYKNSLEIPNNNVDDDNNGYIDDFAGWNADFENDNIDGGVHGTGVAGVAGAAGNNGRGIVGVSWQVKLMTLKSASGLESSIVASYAYALQMRRLYNQTNGKKGAFVVATNSSFGREIYARDAPIWCNMFDAMGQEGILSVGAAPNANANVDVEPDMPSSCTSPYLIVVTSTNSNDRKVANAGYGRNNVDLGAPGNNILTTTPTGYNYLNGTSYATPMLTGAIALAYALPCSDFAYLSKQNPSLAAQTLKNWILQTTNPITDLQNISVTGGRLNVYNTLQRIQQYCGACALPSNVQITTAVNTAQIRFQRTTNTDTVILKYRKVGDPDWITLRQTASPFNISGLTACGNYEMNLTSNCSPIQSRPLSMTFQTDGCCVPPDNITTNIAQNSAALNFTHVTAATAYRLCIKEGNTTACINDISIINNTFNYSNLQACKNYQLNITSVCANTQSATSTINFKTKGCGACYDLAYCRARGNGLLEWIDSIAIGNYRRVSGASAGYTPVPDTPVAIVMRGKNIPFALRARYTTASLSTGFARVWIDYNQDGVFNETTEMVFSNPNFGITTSGNIAIPPYAPTGITRMRVAFKYASTTGNTTPLACGVLESFNLPSGEVEDFCIRIDNNTNIQNIDTDFNINVYPNPFLEYFILENKNIKNKILNMKIVSVDGRILWTKKCDTNETTYLCNDLPPLSIGIYFLQIETEKEVFVKKIMKN